MVVVHDLLQGFLDAEDLLTEEFVVRLSGAIHLDTGIHNHMINALVGQASNMRLLRRNLKVLGERSLPHEVSFAIPIFFQPLHQVHRLPSLCCMTNGASLSSLIYYTFKRGHLFPLPRILLRYTAGKTHYEVGWTEENARSVLLYTMDNTCFVPPEQKRQ